MTDTVIQLARYPSRVDRRRGIVVSGAAELMLFFGPPWALVVAHE
jgi:hypothetical protein